MKNLITLLTGLLLLCLVTSDSLAVKVENDQPAEQAVLISGSPELSSLVAGMVDEYETQYPGMKLVISPGEAGPGQGTIYIVSEKGLGALPENTAQKMLIGRNVILPVINASNPVIEQLRARGISRDALISLLSDPAGISWSKLAGGIAGGTVHYYYTADASVLEGLSTYLGMVPPAGAGTSVGTTGELLKALQKDPLAIGFCRISEAVDYSSNSFLKDIVPLPIDKNANGQIDYFEDIYASPDAFYRGVWLGKYPHELVSGIYAVTFGNTLSVGERSFLKWALGGGQQLLLSEGYADLLGAEKKAKLDRLNEPLMAPEVEGESYSSARTIIMVLLAALILGLIVESIVLYFRNLRQENTYKTITGVHPFNENSVHVPKGLFFDKSHTWAYMEQNGYVRVGLDDFLPHVTGQFTALKMMRPGQKISKGEVLLTVVQKGKHLEIKSPVSGIITEQNKRLLDDASLINQSPYNDGWVYLIEPTNWLREIQFLFMADKFRQWLKGEFSRLKDFLAIARQGNEVRYARVVFQEGGELREGVLADLGPEEWEDFQEKFMETTA